MSMRVLVGAGEVMRFVVADAADVKAMKQPLRLSLAART